MPIAPRILLIDADADRTNAVNVRLQSHGLTPVVKPLQGLDKIPPTDVAILVVPHQTDPERARELERVVGALTEHDVASVVWGECESPEREDKPMLDCLSSDVSLDEVVGRLTVIARYAPMLKRMDRELKHLQTLSTQLNRYFSEIDQEMRLAGRLQRDFLPTQLPTVDTYQVRAVYRPASWVSGDTYDAKRIDDNHIGIFLADAMGHGVAAGLITMFMQQALANKDVHQDVVRIVRPPEVLTRLHYCLCRQQLPSCQFVTGIYAVFDTARHSLRLSRAGHPYPLQITPDGAIAEVTAEGGLLGLPDIDPDFEELQVKIGPGDKIVLYTDGIEDVIIGDAGAEGEARFTEQLREWARLDAEHFALSVEEHLDRRAGSLNPADDITVLVIERGAGAAAKAG